MSDQGPSPKSYRPWWKDALFFGAIVAAFVILQTWVLPKAGLG